MTQEVSAGILGISLIEDQLRIVEGRKEAEEFQVTRVAHGRVRHVFNLEAIADKNMSRRFAEDINRLYATQDFDARNAAFSLDSSMVLIKKIPVDEQLTDPEIGQQIQWEVGQFTIADVEEYIIDYEEILSQSRNGSIKEILVVVVRKKIVESLRRVFSHSDLQLKVVDVDLFSAQRALQQNYDYNQSERIGLIDIEDKKAHFSILSGRSYHLSQEVFFPANNHQMDNKEETAARIISKELKRIVMDEQIGKGVEDLSEIYLYGEAVEDKVVERLQNSYNIRINRANPFKKVRMGSQVADEINETRPERFMISVGAALRGIQ
ncbi:pilus assembly protein PilM [bacterium]|nr:pilus assembly protein PilM [bacterium]